MSRLQLASFQGRAILRPSQSVTTASLVTECARRACKYCHRRPRLTEVWCCAVPVLGGAAARPGPDAPCVAGRAFVRHPGRLAACLRASSRVARRPGTERRRLAEPLDADVAQLAAALSGGELLALSCCKSCNLGTAGVDSQLCRVTALKVLLLSLYVWSSKPVQLAVEPTDPSCCRHDVLQNASYAVRRPDRGDGSRQPHHDAVEPAMSSSTSALSPEALRLQRQLYYEVRETLENAPGDQTHSSCHVLQAVKLMLHWRLLDTVSTAVIYSTSRRISLQAFAASRSKTAGGDTAAIILGCKRPLP